jgi:hypothetical protein
MPFNERHQQRTVRDWAIHYNRGSPHSALGPGRPEPKSEHVTSNEHTHRLPVGYRVVKRSVLGGLHHEYGLASDGTSFCASQVIEKAMEGGTLRKVELVKENGKTFYEATIRKGAKSSEIKVDPNAALIK